MFVNELLVTREQLYFTWFFFALIFLRFSLHTWVQKYTLFPRSLFLFYTIYTTCCVLFSPTVKGLLHLSSPFAMWGEMQYLLIYRRDGTSTSVKWCTLESHPRWKVLRKGKMLYAWNNVHEQWSSGMLTSAGPRFCHPISHAQINLVVLSKCPVQTAFLLSVLCFEQRNASTYILKWDFFNLKKMVFHCYYLHSQAVFVLQKLQAQFPAIAANRKDCLYILSVLLACSIALFCYLPWLEGLTMGHGSQKIPAPPLLPPLLSTAVSVCLSAGRVFSGFVVRLLVTTCLCWGSMACLFAKLELATSHTYAWRGI